MPFRKLVIFTSTNMLFDIFWSFFNLSGGQITALDLTCDKCFLMVVHGWRLEFKAPMRTLPVTLIEDIQLLRWLIVFAWPRMLVSRFDTNPL